MMHKAWCGIGDVPYCFSMSSVTFQGHTGRKIDDFDPNCAFPDCNSRLNSPIALKWYTKNCQFWPKLNVSGLQPHFEFIDVFKMMRKAWSSIEDVPYCFLRSSVKIQGHTGQKIANFDPNWAFPDCNCSLNSLMAMKCCTKLEVAYIEEVSFCCSRSSVKLQGHTGEKNHRHWPKFGVSGV